MDGQMDVRIERQIDEKIALNSREHMSVFNIANRIYYNILEDRTLKLLNYCLLLYSINIIYPLIESIDNKNHVSDIGRCLCNKNNRRCIRCV